MHDETQHSAIGVPERKAQLIPHTALTKEIYDAIIVVAGSRNFNDYELFSECMEERLLKDDLVDLPLIVFVSGKAKTGADDMIIRWCQENGFPWAEFPADWDNLDVPGAVIRTRRDGKRYNAGAGHLRNREMAKVGTHLILFWDGESKGTKNMLEEATKYGLERTINLVDPDPEWTDRRF